MKELEKTYNPADIEDRLYQKWLDSKYFHADAERGRRNGKKPFTIVMPPPNANGNLHVGHALGSAIQDILVRYHRMQGYDAVYIPGADHAGFETWVVYERELEKHGQTRFDFNREELYAQVWDFVAKRRGDMELQLRAIGVGADWDDLVFTLDDKVIKTVYDTFEKMWQDGYIYRGERIVNYCTQHQTSFSDYEVVHKNEKGKLWEIAYPLIDKVGEIVIATTRPETMFGDVAVAVNPNDERYKDLVGCKALLPIVKREIPIIADDYVDPAYGTGMVKITPAHDPNDFEVGKRHNLELVQVIDFDGKMINVPGQFVGMTALEARKRVLAALEIDELLRGEKDIEHQVGHCYKCGSVIEPLAKEQWFVKMRQLADNAIAAIERQEVTFTPENKGDVVIKYLKDIKDWNISRQIPWGIPIPMFQSKTNLDDWRYSTEVDKKEIVVDGTTYRREEDTLDTWFSSGQWPYITTDYLDAGKLAKYYPNTVMETAGDILFAWVARMIMLGLYRTGQVPFKHVYLHGLVLDEKGIKMSKSKGNVINPMETVAKYGSDALRMGIIASRSAAQPQAFNTGKVVAARNFCNKLWNIARYTENLVGDRTPAASPQLQSLADHWIARQLDEAAQSLDRQVATYHFAEAGETIYHTVWDDVADWYIEASKVEQNIDMNAYVLDTVLRLTHPFAPFLTETIWQALPWHDTILASETMPDRLEYDDIAAAAFGRLKDLVSEARYVVSELPGNKRYGLLYMDDSLVADNIELVKKLARVTSVEHVDQVRGLRLAASGRDVWLDIDDETLYEHQANLEKRLAEERQHIRTLESRLANDNYVAKAPAALVEESRKTLREKQELITRLQNELQVVSNK